MKKNRSFALLLAVLLILGCLTACGSSSKDAVEMTITETTTSSSFQSTMEESVVEEEYEVPESVITTSTSDTASEIMNVEEVKTYAEKIIYSGYVYMQTTEFDEALVALEQAVKEFGGFVQNSDTNGNVYHYEDGTVGLKSRWAYYEVRIPAEQFDAFMTVTEGIGSVTNSGRTAENVTSQYTDYEARLSSLYTQEERLLAMLEESGDLESLIALEARLSEVRYEIESIERNLRNLDQRLAYSTVTLELQEVEVVTPTVTVQRTFGEKLSDAFASGWNSFVRSCQRFVLNTARSLPTLVLLAAMVVVVLIVIRKIRKKRLQKAAVKTEPPKEEKP